MEEKPPPEEELKPCPGCKEKLFPRCKSCPKYSKWRRLNYIADEDLE